MKRIDTPFSPARKISEDSIFVRRTTFNDESEETKLSMAAEKDKDFFERLQNKKFFFVVLKKSIDENCFLSLKEILSILTIINLQSEGFQYMVVLRNRLRSFEVIKKLALDNQTLVLWDDQLDFGNTEFEACITIGGDLVSLYANKVLNKRKYLPPFLCLSGKYEKLELGKQKSKSSDKPSNDELGFAKRKSNIVSRKGCDSIKQMRGPGGRKTSDITHPKIEEAAEVL
jgi:hypothetical protein